MHSKIADQFRQILRATIDQIFPDQNGLVMVDKAPVGRNATLLSDAVSKGAKAIYGDVNDKRELATAMRPVILEDVKKDADLYYQESFGPTVSLFVVENDEEAIQIANDTEYGELRRTSLSLPPSSSHTPPFFPFTQPNLTSPPLSNPGLASAVFTENLQRGLRIARQIETGAVHINSMSVHDEPSLPHGGAKKSGFGRFNGEEGLREWYRMKTITWAN